MGTVLNYFLLVAGNARKRLYFESLIRGRFNN